MPARFTIRQLNNLQAKGKIRDFKVIIPEKQLAAGKIVAKHFKKKSPALDFIGSYMLQWCKERCLQLQEEYRFDNKRKWRFDYAVPELMIAVEFEGGIFQANSGHKTAKHYTKDATKYNRAAELGWRVYRYTALNYKNIVNDLNNKYA